MKHCFKQEMPTIHQLRKLGFKVRVSHNFLHGGLCCPDPVPKNISELAERFTQIELRSPAGNEYTGISYCSLKDNYDRKKGNYIALGRALKLYFNNECREE